MFGWFLPHRGDWKQAKVWTEGIRWREPLKTKSAPNQPAAYSRSLIKTNGKGLQISSVTSENNDLIIRLFNAEGSAETTHQLTFDSKADAVKMIELNGEEVRDLPVTTRDDGRLEIELQMPQFGIRTLRLVNPQKIN